MKMQQGKGKKITVLSKYFDNNVNLVANMCSKCYSETDDVKIVAVNKKFLKQVEARKRASTLLLHNDKKLKLGILDIHLNITSFTKDQYEYKPNCDIKLDCPINKTDGTCILTTELKKLEDTVPIMCSPKLETNNEMEICKTNVSPPFVTRPINFANLTRNASSNGSNLLSSIFCPSDYLQIPSQPSETSETIFCTPPGSQSPLWNPPQSPHNLIEESVYHKPWALLAATIFLNKTSCYNARPYVESFLSDFPGPEAVLAKQPSELEKYFVSLGLFRRRAEQVWRMSYDFLHKDWKNVNELYGIGKYGEDAYRMFCLGDMCVEPTDRFLRIYKAWYEMERHREKYGVVEDASTSFEDDQNAQ